MKNTTAVCVLYALGGAFRLSIFGGAALLFYSYDMLWWAVFALAAGAISIAMIQVSIGSSE